MAATKDAEENEAGGASAKEPATAEVPTPAVSSTAPAPTTEAKSESNGAAKPASAAPKAASKASKKAAAKKEDGASKEEAPPVPLKSASSSREDNLVYDLQKMTATDIAPLDPKADFLAYTRDSVQMLVNKLFALPRAKMEEGIFAELPEQGTFKLPRAKPVPKEKPKTRWEKFMEERNMKKRKRSRMVYDEVTGDWRPRWGYGSIKKTKEAAHDWVHEVKEGEDPMQNPFERKSAEKRLQNARQRLREVRNKVEASGFKMSAAAPDLAMGKCQRGAEGLKEAIKRAQKSSASMGKFDRLAANEATNLQTRKRKATVTTPAEEKARYMKVSTRILEKGGKVDQAMAAKVGMREASSAQPKGLKKEDSSVRMKGVPGKFRRSKMGNVGSNKQKRRRIFAK